MMNKSPLILITISLVFGLNAFGLTDTLKIVNSNDQPLKKCKIYKIDSDGNKHYVNTSNAEGIISISDICVGIEKIWIKPRGIYAPRYIDCPLESKKIEVLVNEEYKSLVFNSQLKFGSVISNDTLSMRIAFAKYKIANYDSFSDSIYSSLMMEVYLSYANHLNIDSKIIKLVKYSKNGIELPNYFTNAIKAEQNKFGFNQTGVIDDKLLIETLGKFEVSKTEIYNKID